MRATLVNWLESKLNVAIAGVESLLVEASNRRFYRVRLAAAWPGDQTRRHQPLPAADTDASPQPGQLPSGCPDRLSRVPAQARTGDQTLVVMDSPPELERNANFVAVQKLLFEHRLPVPQLFAMDSKQGFFLLSDLGDRHIKDVYGTPLENAAIASAIDNLAALQRIEAPEIPPYLDSRFRDELGIFVEWFLGNLLDEPLPSSAADTFEHLLENAAKQPQCLIHRDYHCRNLLLSPSGAIGIVDFQDALIGPATYDLACLLWDCYHSFSDRQRRYWQSYYASVSPFAFRADALPRVLDLTGLQRQLKAIGIFARLMLRDGKSSHLRYITPVLEAAVRLCAGYPETRPMGKWLAGLIAVSAKTLNISAG